MPDICPVQEEPTEDKVETLSESIDMIIGDYLRLQKYFQLVNSIFSL
jgi:hypothetical protein